MKWKLGLAAIAAMSMGPAAEAAVVLVTYTGIVTSGTDDTNFFGVGYDLKDQPFKLQFTLDSAPPGATITCESTYCEIKGEFAANPLPTTHFTINEVSRSWGVSTLFRPGGLAWQYNEPGGFGDSVLHNSERQVGRDEGDSVYAEITSQVNDFTGSTDVTAPLDYFVQAGDDTLAFFSTFDRDPDTGVFSRNVDARMSLTRVTIAPLNGAIREPSTWAMLIVGFGLVGAVMRRRAKVHLVAG